MYEQEAFEGCKVTGEWEEKQGHVKTPSLEFNTIKPSRGLLYDICFKNHPFHTSSIYALSCQ